MEMFNSSRVRCVGVWFPAGWQDRRYGVQGVLKLPLELKEGFNVESIEAACAFANAGWVEILDAHDFKGNIQD